MSLFAIASTHDQQGIAKLIGTRIVGAEAEQVTAARKQIKEYLRVL